MGPFVALLCVKFKFVIFDWRTGKNLAEITFEDEDFVKSFFFVDQERLGLILGQRNPPEIEIYRINPYDDPPDMSLTAKYHLPALTTTQTLHISCNSGPSPQPVDTNSRYKGNTAYSTPPFSPRLEDKIILLELAVQTLFYHHIEYHTIIIRGETFMNVPPEADCVDGVYVIPSSLWMAQTYVERTTRTGNWACFVYGSRLVKLLPKSLTYENTEEESEVAEDAEVPPNEQYPIQDVDEEVSEEQGEEEAPEEHANFDEEQAMSWPVEVVILDVNPRLIAMAEHEDDRFGLKKPGRTIRRAEPLTLGATDWNPQLPVMETRFSPVTLNFKYSDEFVAMLDAERLMIIKLGHVDGRSRVPMYMDIYSP
ncbi:hypothetical protein FRC17_006041 [Serendipita sp. 399]|nr:hypothetical protein FRC17_006041 [Serendipita sp. 399]